MNPPQTQLAPACGVSTGLIFPGHFLHRRLSLRWTALAEVLARPCVTFTLALGMLLLGRDLQPAQAGEPPTVQQVRDAITRSLPFVEKEGVAWIEKRKCVTCHQVSNFVWSFNEVRRHGFEVDLAKLKQWNEWTLKNSFGGNLYYKLPEPAFEKLAQGGVGADEVARLKPLQNKEFVTERSYLEAMEQLVAPETVAKHKALILKSGMKPGVGGGTGDSPSALFNVMLRSGTAAAAPVPDTALQAMFEALRSSQQADGLWKTSSQFLGMNRPKDESTVVNTMWILLTLSYEKGLSEPLVQAHARARQGIEKAKPGTSTEFLMLQALLAHADGRAEQCRDLLQQLLQEQREDGGWAWLKDRQASPDSDPLTTGQVLYALGTLGRSPADSPVRKALKYLIQAQATDGSWPVRWLAFNVENKKDHTDGDKVFTYWGTTWSVLGLLSVLPK